MELEELTEEGAVSSTKSISHGHQFGIVQKMDKSFRSFAKYGTVCEIIAFPEQT